MDREGVAQASAVYAARTAISALLLAASFAPLATSSCAANGVGAPCVLELEDDPRFTGSALDQVFYETNSYQCQTGLCLSNHFQGRVTCPYGQKADGTGLSSEPCALPLTGGPVQGVEGDRRRAARVAPQCLGRPPEQAVYCSCRCANMKGRTDDGARYCTCPNGFECAQLDRPAFGPGGGGYCIKEGSSKVRCERLCDKGDPSARCEGETTTRVE